MTKFVRFMAPVDAGSIEAMAQALFDSIKGAQAASQAKTRQMGGAHDWTPDELRRLEGGEIPGGFAGPNKTFPIGRSSDVRDAWALADLADNPDAIRANIKAIAERCGWASALPVRR